MFEALLLAGTMLILILLSVPVPFAIGFSTIYFFLDIEIMQMYTFVQRNFSGLNSFTLLAIPLFIMTGQIMNKSGITDRLIDFAEVLVGRIVGGIGHVNIVVSMFFAGISGSATADTAGIGSVLIPAMESKGYSKELSVVITAASSTLGTIIPPSIMMIIYASSAGNVSVGGLFVVGIVPGIAIGLSQMGLCYIYSKKYNYGKMKKKTIKEILVAFKRAILPLFTPIILLYGIIGGVVTATEAAVVAATYSLILCGVIYKNLTISKIIEILEDTIKMSAPVLLCIAMAEPFGYIIAFLRIPELIGEGLIGFTGSSTVFLLIIFLVFLIVGFFMDASPAIIILTPIVAPIASEFGVHPLHFGVVVVATLSLGLITPPYGLSLLLASKIAGIEVEDTFSVAAIFISVFAVIIILMILFPRAILFIPRLIAPNLIP